MRFSFRWMRLALGLAACTPLAACATKDTSDSPKHVTTPPPPDSAMLAFDDTSILTLVPGASAALHVTATPPQYYTIGFTLLGDPADGSLDHGTVLTDTEGQASVTLRAPSVTTTFRVRASLFQDGAPTGVTAERAVAVGGKGFGSVSVAPSYLGHRTVTSWSASVSVGTCAELAMQGSVPSDASITASAPFGQKPLITKAPVGPNLAVAVRAGHFAWGCTDTTSLTAGATLEVPVAVIDEPLDLADSNLAATFTYAPDPDPYATLLGEGVSVLVDAFMPLSSSEGTILLNGMAAATTDPATFAAMRVEQSWDALADQHFTSLGTSLRATCSAWATMGLAMQPTSMQASLVGGQGGPVAITVTQLGNLDATTAGCAAAPGATWTSQPDDSVLLSGTLLWEPSRFAGASSLAPAVAAHPGAASVADALALEADCHGLASAMGAFGSCTLDCVEKLCDAAIAERWTAALAASAKAAALGQIVVQASAAATVGDEAEVVALDGHWQGKISGVSTDLALKGGTLTATDGSTAN